MLREVKTLFWNSYRCKCRCTLTALIAGLILGVIAAFLQITGTITATQPAVGAALGLAAVYLGLLLLATAISGRRISGDCGCSALNTLLVGILGTLLLAAILLATGITATGVLTAIGVGGLVFFLVLIAAGTACFIRALAGYGDDRPVAEN